MNSYCIYCNEWVHSRIIKRTDNGDEESSSKKKRKKKKREKSIVRDCAVTGKAIKLDSPTCRYFKPTNTFYCTGKDHRLTLITCLHKRRMYKRSKGGKKPDNPECKSCRQFDREIYPVVNKFEIYKQLTPLRQITRRPQTRRIKRRPISEAKPKRVITRRKKKRTIKRR